ncbi:hypothetical protein HDU76_012537 [Blyttiomyces sp. JEL0837]|nr:hypothetical protein HDU76_012537 [Blyttiomyces sp. JEL0837]
MEVLIVGRALAGLGGGGIFSLVLIIISDIVSMQDRVLLYLNLDASPESIMTKVKRIDWLGVILMFGSVTCFLTPLQLGGTTWAWSAPQTIALFILAFLLLIMFVLVECYVAKEPIVPPQLFQNTSVTALLLIAISLGATFFAGLYYLSLFFQVSYGDSATQSGLETIPLVFGLVILSIISGNIVSRTGKYLPFLYAGGLVLVVGCTLISFFNANTPRVEQVFFLLIFGVGAGAIIQIRVLAIQAAVDASMVAIATATAQACQSLGGAIGVAIVGTVFNNVLVTKIREKPNLSLFIDDIHFPDPTQVGQH